MEILTGSITAEFVRGLRYILWTVILAFICYAIQILLQIMR